MNKIIDKRNTLHEIGEEHSAMMYLLVYLADSLHAMNREGMNLVEMKQTSKALEKLIREKLG